MATGGYNPYLPPEIIIHILKRLPVKSILRFRAVCKDWRNLLKSQYFIEEHYHHSAYKNPLRICHAGNRNRHLCLLRFEKETVEAKKLVKLPKMKSLRRVRGIIGSSNGLLCVKLGNEKVDALHSLLLLNPATREVNRVPKSTKNYGRRFHYGFGYSRVVRDYKIVRIHSMVRTNGHICVDRVEVYSLRTGSWKEVEFGVIHSSAYLYTPVAVNGVIFWLGLLWGEYCRRVIISFDLATEVFTLIPTPSSAFVQPLSYRRVLDVCENKLAMIHQYIHDLKMPDFLDFWLLEEGSDAYGKSWSWSKKYSITADPPFLTPICLWRNEIVCSNCIDPYFLFKHTANNEVKKFHISIGTGYVDVNFFYAESLASMRDMSFE